MKEVTKDFAIKKLICAMSILEFGLPKLEGFLSTQSLENAGGNCVSGNLSEELERKDIDCRYPATISMNLQVVNATFRIYELLSSLTDDQLEFTLNQFRNILVTDNSKESDFAMVTGDKVSLFTSDEILSEAKDKIVFKNASEFNGNPNYLTFTSDLTPDANFNPVFKTEIECCFAWFRAKKGKEINYKDINELGRIQVRTV